MSTGSYSTTGLNAGRSQPPDGYKADAEAIIEAINRPQKWTGETITTPDGRTIEREEPTEWRWLPDGKPSGFGTDLEDCGDEILKFCTDCGKPFAEGSTCYRSVCPRCAPSWCMRQSKEIVAKLKAVWAYQYTALDEHPYYHHLVLSPPDDWQLDGDPETVYWRTLDVVKDILEELHVAGIPFYHAHRGDEEETDTDLGEWKERLYSDREWEGDVAEELEHSPHFHVLGIAPHVDVGVTERVEDETGWVIARIEDDNGISIPNDYALARAAAYCLSHTMLYEDSNGDMSAAYHPRVAERVPDGRPTIQDQTRAEADQLVQATAPKVLGVDFASVACVERVPPELVEKDNRINLAAGSTDPRDLDAGCCEGDAGDGTRIDDLAGRAESLVDDAERVRCEGERVHISNAEEYLNDGEWRSQAFHASDLERELAEWLRLTGIPSV